ncbi:hypothetical protein GOEFS_039_00270 [Gordonia effusa NBRC 100432]|uniref:Uncharacterized protein n=1 Tax=Gordonia effusa NBRC 100432 TaxID=1077974 RepID=H0QY92_9ACTN|nr:DUF1963 domain-containing protein [Gordonia effusa]GAB17793.1 hypothetical protein GOEFS_039_00270 [Gordonia effusa NBRC 100432]
MKDALLSQSQLLEVAEPLNAPGLRESVLRYRRSAVRFSRANGDDERSGNWFGGGPLVPPGFEWPRDDSGSSLRFVAQFSSDVAAVAGYESSGIAIFLPEDVSNEGYLEERIASGITSPVGWFQVIPETANNSIVEGPAFSEERHELTAWLTDTLPMSFDSRLELDLMWLGRNILEGDIDSPTPGSLFTEVRSRIADRAENIVGDILGCSVGGNLASLSFDGDHRKLFGDNSAIRESINILTIDEDDEMNLDFDLHSLCWHGVPGETRPGLFLE